MVKKGRLMNRVQDGKFGTVGKSVSLFIYASLEGFQDE